jgi:hypothetical protein
LLSKAVVVVLMIAMSAASVLRHSGVTVSCQLRLQPFVIVLLLLLLLLLLL